jgi:hypothetical protein
MAEMPASPILPSHVAVLNDLVSEQQKSLLSVLQPMSDRLGDAITWQQNALNTVTGDVKSALKRQTAKQGKALQHVANGIVENLHGRVVEQEVRLAPIQAMLATQKAGQFPTWKLWCQDNGINQCLTSDSLPPAGAKLAGEFPSLTACQRAAATIQCGATTVPPPGGAPPPIGVPPPAGNGQCCPPSTTIVNIPPCPTPDTTKPPTGVDNSKCDQCVKCDDIKDLPGYKVYQIPVDKLAAEDAYIESDCGTAYWQDKAADVESASSIADVLSQQQWSVLSQDDMIAIEQEQDSFESNRNATLLALTDQIDSTLFQQQFIMV